jgi:hypothetical protein
MVLSVTSVVLVIAKSRHLFEGTISTSDGQVCNVSSMRVMYSHYTKLEAQGGEDA